MYVCRAAVLVVVITRVEGVDLGQFFFTCLEEFLLKLGVVPLNCIIICDCKKVRVLRLVNLQEQSEEHRLTALIKPQCRWKMNRRTERDKKGQQR